MKKQNSKKDSDLLLNHYITVNFKCYFNLVSTTHETHLLFSVQMKAEILEPVNIRFLPKIYLNKSMDMATDFDTITEIKICINTAINLKITVSLVAAKIDFNNQK